MLLGTANRVFWKFGNLILGSWDNIFFSKKHKKINFCVFLKKKWCFSHFLSAVNDFTFRKSTDFGSRHQPICQNRTFLRSLKRNENNLKKFPSLFIFHIGTILLTKGHQMIPRNLRQKLETSFDCYDLVTIYCGPPDVWIFPPEILELCLRFAGLIGGSRKRRSAFFWIYS